MLPRCARPHPDATERCAVFAAALLEGKVLPSFAGGAGAAAVAFRGAVVCLFWLFCLLSRGMELLSRVSTCPA